MANYHIKRPSRIDATKDSYYTGAGGKWTHDYSARKQYTNKTTTEAMLNNPDGTNGGWVGASVVTE
jgi:hypothetical protein|tara:strand:+ start:287 stop:484 length:198 start_codon:yes stop_codon:yes gene_type:complete